MTKKGEIFVKDVAIKTMTKDGIDYICITDIARQKNAAEPKDVVKNWMRQKNTLEYLGLWEKLNNPNFKGVEFDPLLAEAGSNSFTMSPTRWVELTAAIGVFTKNGAGGGTFAQRDIAFKFANWVSVEFELYLVMESPCYTLVFFFNPFTFRNTNASFFLTLLLMNRIEKTLLKFDLFIRRLNTYKISVGFFKTNLIRLINHHIDKFL